MVYLYKYLNYSFIKLYKTLYKGSRDIAHFMGGGMFLSSIFFWCLVVFNSNILEKMHLHSKLLKLILFVIIVLLLFLIDYLNRVTIFYKKTPNEILYESDKYSLIPAALIFFGGIISLIIVTS